jgi:hypothetical protein
MLLGLAGLAGIPLGPAPWVPAARAQALALPVWTPGSQVKAPCYRGDVLELQLTAGAARRVLPRGAGPTRAVPVGRLGLAAVDAVAAEVGAVAFEPEFRGETPPSAGGGPDLTAFEVVHLSPGSDLATALARFRALPEVASADPIALMPVSVLPSDSLAQATFWLYNPRNGRADIHAPEAWQLSMGDTSVVVGIIDTGVIPWHPDLGGRGERGNLWVNWVERAGVPGVDDDGNGYVDDVAGWDFVQTGALAAAGEDAHDEDNDPNDWGGHGTAVAGIVGAIAGNDIGLAGVVPRARMMPLRIGWLQQGDFPPAGTIDMAYAAAAIRYATRMGCAVVNCSWQSINQSGLDAAVTAATRAGMIVVNAAGNGGTPFTYLGQRDDVISVAGTDSTDVVWPGSVVGPWVDLSASGTGMVSTMFQRVSATDSLLGRTPAYRGFLNGTSFAAPQVAGAVALMQAQRKALGELPLTPAGALLRLRETTDNIDAFQIPQVIGYGTGRLNVYRALGDPPRSLAVRARARSMGPPVILQYNTGRSLVVYAMSDRSLVAYDGASGDTVWVRPLPALPAASIAAVDTPQPLGPVIAVATTTGTVFLFHDDGQPVAGWPVTAQAGLNLSTGVAIADVDGDGHPELVAGGSTLSTAKLWVWRLDGTLLTGFPFDAGVSGMSSLAIGDVDGTADAEIAYTDATGALHLVGFDGIERPGFPTAPASAARAPVMVRVLTFGSPVEVMLASSGALTAYAADGHAYWSAPLVGSPSQDPVLADLDGDGEDEIVLSLAGPTSLTAFTARGFMFARPGWPRPTFAGPQGPLVVGPLAAGHGPCVMYLQSGGLVAFDENGDSLRAFPKPGGAGLSPSLADLDGDGATEVTAGTASADSNVYTYDAGAATWTPSLAHWPTPRGDMGRTASHARGTPPPFVIDRIRPARVTDLVAFGHDSSTVFGSFTVTGDDSLVGTVALGELRRAPFPLDELNFGTGILVSLSPMPAPGSNLPFVDNNLPAGSRWWYALRLIDDAGNASAVSNSDSVSLPGQPPAAIADLRVLAVTETTAVLAWTAPGAGGPPGRPDHYKVSGSTAPLDSANVDAAPLQLNAAAYQDAGGAETTLVARLAPGRRWRFAVRAVDASANVGAISNIAEVVTPTGGALRGHSGMALAARPQPAATSVTIDWQGDESGTVSQWLVVYDLSGRERRRIALGTEPGGSYNWDGRDGESRLLPAGLYFLRLVSGARHAGSRVVFVR